MAHYPPWSRSTSRLSRSGCSRRHAYACPVLELPTRLRPVLDPVWEFVRVRGFTTDHNVFVYRPEGDGLLVQLGVEVAEPFDDTDDVVCVRTPAGNAATAVHVGPYHRLGETHDAVTSWCRAHDVSLTGTGWEVYGDWEDDPARLRTDVFHEVA